MFSKVLRCSAFFIGINHASAKVEYPSTFQLAVTLAALCCCLWWCFDRAISGMGAGLLTAFASAIISHFYVTHFHHKYCHLKTFNTLGLRWQFPF